MLIPGMKDHQGGTTLVVPDAREKRTVTEASQTLEDFLNYFRMTDILCGVKQGLQDCSRAG